MDRSPDDSLWNGDKGAGGISWVDRSRMGPLRGVIDAADTTGRRNEYMHSLHLRVLIKELRKAGSIGNALDFGCGTGRFIKTLTTYSNHVCATDKEVSMLEAARTYAESCKLEIKHCEPASVPFDDAQFDFVLCSSVLCVTLPDIVEGIIKELARVTKTGGRLLLLEQVAEARGLPASRYYNALRSAGFKLLHAYPIRSSDSRMTSLVTNACIPLQLFDALAAVELFITKFYANPLPARYVEYAIVGRKSATAHEAPAIRKVSANSDQLPCDDGCATRSGTHTITPNSTSISVIKRKASHAWRLMKMARAASANATVVRIAQNI